MLPRKVGNCPEISGQLHNISEERIYHLNDGGSPEIKRVFLCWYSRTGICFRGLLYTGYKMLVSFFLSLYLSFSLSLSFDRNCILSAEVTSLACMSQVKIRWKKGTCRKSKCLGILRPSEHLLTLCSNYCSHPII